MNEEFEQLLEAQWEGRLDGAGRARLDALAASDPAVARRVEEEARLSGMLACWGPNPAPRDLAASVFARLKAEPEEATEEVAASPEKSKRAGFWSFFEMPALKWGMGFAMAAFVFAEVGIIIHQNNRPAEMSSSAIHEKVAAALAPAPRPMDQAASRDDAAGIVQAVSQKKPADPATDHASGSAPGEQKMALKKEDGKEIRRTQIAMANSDNAREERSGGTTAKSTEKNVEKDLALVSAPEIANALASTPSGAVPVPQPTPAPTPAPAPKSVDADPSAAVPVPQPTPAPTPVPKPKSEMPDEAMNPAAPIAATPAETPVPAPPPAPKPEAREVRVALQIMLPDANHPSVFPAYPPASASLGGGPDIRTMMAPGRSGAMQGMTQGFRGNVPRNGLAGTPGGAAADSQQLPTTKDIEVALAASGGKLDADSIEQVPDNPRLRLVRCTLTPQQLGDFLAALRQQNFMLAEPPASSIGELTGQTATTASRATQLDRFRGIEGNGLTIEAKGAATPNGAPALPPLQNIAPGQFGVLEGEALVRAAAQGEPTGTVPLNGSFAAPNKQDRPIHLLLLIEQP